MADVIEKAREQVGKVDVALKDMVDEIKRLRAIEDAAKRFINAGFYNGDEKSGYELNGERAYLCDADSFDELETLAPLPVKGDTNTSERFLGRCSHCLDNASLGGRCTDSHPDCLQRRSEEALANKET